MASEHPFYSAIRARRDELGWSREQLVRLVKAAGHADFTVRSLANYETGESSPNIERACAIATALQMSLDEACGLKPRSPYRVVVDGVFYVPASEARAEKRGSSEPVPPLVVQDVDEAAELGSQLHAPEPRRRRSRREPPSTPS